MVSKLCMALDINIKKPKRDRRKGVRRAGFFSRLVRLIFLSNLVGLVVLIIGALATSRFSQSLIDAKTEDLSVHATLLTTLMGDTASGVGGLSDLDREAAIKLLRRVDLPDQWRIRLFDKSGALIADSALMDGSITITELAPLTVQSDPSASKWPGIQTVFSRINTTLTKTVARFVSDLPWRVRERERLRQDMKGDIRKAFLGQSVSGARYDESDNLIVSVTQPIQRVQTVLGAVILESSDVSRIVEAEGRALIPILGLAFLASLLSSLALTLFIARPIRKLARAAEYVTRSSKRRDAIPDLSSRRDEIGDLSLVITNMTNGLYDRIDDIANFAADVAHEIKNPLTSLRSASETLRVAKKPEQREKLIDIIQSDVHRMDRLISDISKASKVDASLARETAEIVDVRLMLRALEDNYQQTRRDTGVEVKCKLGLETRSKGETAGDAPLYIRAFETPFAQVLRNLIDNAITFSPKGGTVWLSAKSVQAVDTYKNPCPKIMITVEDEGPGIPPDNLETVFERFYTERPIGAQFGSHSGLGLAISRQIVQAHRGIIYAENRNRVVNASGDSRSKESDGKKTSHEKRSIEKIDRSERGKAETGARFIILLPQHTLLS